MLMVGLTAVSVCCYFIASLIMAHVAFNVRMTQGLNELEIRRVDQNDPAEYCPPYTAAIQGAPSRMPRPCK